MFFSLFVSAAVLSASAPDTSAESFTDSIRTATVIADRGILISRTDTVAIGESFTVSDALRMIPGLHVGDNGSVSGLKNVSLRGLGSAHTSIYLDGVRVGNVQSGQNDLAMIGPEDYGSAVVDYAQNSLSFDTARPVFGSSPVKGSARVDCGSFSTWRPSARVDIRLADGVALSSRASFLASKGDFPCGDGFRRSNNDIRQVRAGLDLFGDADRGDYHFKLYCNAVERGAPGSLQWPSEDRQSDRNVLVQGRVRMAPDSRYSLILSGKYSYDDIRYSSAWGDSDYGQTEFRVSSSHAFRPCGWLTLGLAADFSADMLDSDVYDASRMELTLSPSAAIRGTRFSADLALGYDFVSDRGSRSWSALSPSADIRVKVLDCLDLVAFGRRAYRIPVFNELYYTGYGNPRLNEEDAWLLDAGLDFVRGIGGMSLKVRIDGFHNTLKNKISSAPSPEDPNVWMPYNIGRVISDGADVLAGFGYSAGAWTVGIDAAYSFMDAVDRTEGRQGYGLQIPYVPRHSLSVSAAVGAKGWSLSPVWQLHAGRRDTVSGLPDWNTLDIRLRKELVMGRGSRLSLSFMVRNAMDFRYEVVGGYPMEGRSFMAGAGYSF